MASSAAAFIPTPPKLAYMNSSLRATRAASAGRTASTSRPATADTTSSPPRARPGTATQKSRKTFLQDNETAATLLPQPLPPGIPYVAAFTTYDDLIKRNILHQGPKNQVRLSTEDVRILYEAKCDDQSLKPTWDREMRFLELICQHCKGQHFVLRENGLGPRSAEAICRVLASSESFTLLDLSGNRLRDLGAQYIASLFATNDCLVHLSLKSNDIGHEGIEALCSALSSNHTLTSLDLGGIRGINRNHVGGRGAEAIGKLLADNQVLWSIDLGSNGLGLEGSGLVASGLKVNQTLRKLFLSSNNIGAEGARLLAAALVDAHVEVLDLCGNDIGDAGAAHISAAFSTGREGSETIHVLYLDHNNIREAGAASLASMIRSNQSLRELSLSQNNLGSGMAPFFENLKDNRKLQKLELVQCGLQEVETLGLATALSNGSRLNVLDISKNRIGDKCGAKIMDALAVNVKLTALRLAGCALGNATGGALAKALKDNATITEVDLKQNTLHGLVGEALLEELTSNSTIRVLDLAFNDIPYLSQTGIDAALKRNRESWKRGEGKRLEGEIDGLAYAQRDLFQVEEDIESERRAVKERGDELVRRKDTARGQSENNKRILKELQDAYSAVTAIFNEKRDNYRKIEEQIFQDQQRMELKVASLNRRLENEREKRERVLKETERLRRNLKTITDQQEHDLKPLITAYEAADSDRQTDLTDARWQAEALIETELKILQLELVLGVQPDRSVPKLEASTIMGASARKQSTVAGVKKR